MLGRPFWEFRNSAGEYLVAGFGSADVTLPKSQVSFSGQEYRAIAVQEDRSYVVLLRHAEMMAEPIQIFGEGVCYLPHHHCGSPGAYSQSLDLQTGMMHLQKWTRLIRLASLTDRVIIPCNRGSEKGVSFRMVGHQRIIPIEDPSGDLPEIRLVAPIAMMTNHSIQHFLTEVDRGVGTTSKAINRLQEYNEDRIVRMQEIAKVIRSVSSSVEAPSDRREPDPLYALPEQSAIWSIFWRSFAWMIGVPSEQFSKISSEQSVEVIQRFSNRKVDRYPIAYKTYTHPWVINWRVGKMVYWLPKGALVTRAFLQQVLHDPDSPIRSPLCVSIDAELTCSLEFWTGMMVLDAPVVRLGS